MRVNSDSPNNSVLSTETSSSDSCYASGEVEETDKKLKLARLREVVADDPEEVERKYTTNE